MKTKLVELSNSEINMLCESLSTMIGDYETSKTAYKREKSLLEKLKQIQLDSILKKVEA